MRNLLKNSHGEISTLIVLAVFVVVGVGTLLSTTINQNRNTTSTRASELAPCNAPEGCGGTCIQSINNGCGYGGCRRWERCQNGGCLDTTAGGTGEIAPDSCLDRSVAGSPGNEAYRNSQPTAPAQQTPTTGAQPTAPAPNGANCLNYATNQYTIPPGYCSPQNASGSIMKVCVGGSWVNPSNGSCVTGDTFCIGRGYPNTTNFPCCGGVAKDANNVCGGGTGTLPTATNAPNPANTSTPTQKPNTPTPRCWPQYGECEATPTPTKTPTATKTPTPPPGAACGYGGLRCCNPGDGAGYIQTCFNGLSCASGTCVQPSNTPTPTLRPTVVASTPTKTPTPPPGATCGYLSLRCCTSSDERYSKPCLGGLECESGSCVNNTARPLSPTPTLRPTVVASTPTKTPTPPPGATCGYVPMECCTSGDPCRESGTSCAGGHCVRPTSVPSPTPVPYPVSMASTTYFDECDMNNIVDGCFMLSTESLQSL